MITTILVVLVEIAVCISSTNTTTNGAITPPVNQTSNHQSSNVNHRKESLLDTPCTQNSDCRLINGAACDVGSSQCACSTKQLPVANQHHCLGASNFDQFCSLDMQCKFKDNNSYCDHDFNVCRCQERYTNVYDIRARRIRCKESEEAPLDTSPGAYVDPTLFGLMGGLALMFIVMCVVLRLFAKRQFGPDASRNIFNTPNPRLMNASILSEKSKLSNSRRVSTRQSSLNRSAAASAAGAFTAASVRILSDRHLSVVSSSCNPINEEGNDNDVNTKDDEIVCQVERKSRPSFPSHTGSVHRHNSTELSTAADVPMRERHSIRIKPNEESEISTEMAP